MKRILSTVLILLIVLSSFPITVIADTDNPVNLLADATYANAQAVNLSDFILRTKDVEASSISDKDASDWTCFEWSQIENSSVSRYGGKGYHVKEAMCQSIFTSVTLKPNTKYSFSFEWKAVDSPAGPVFPDKVFVVAKDDIDMWDTSNKTIWHPDNGFQDGGFNLETTGGVDCMEAAKTFEWQNKTATFTTKDKTEYGLLIHFQATGHGHQEIYISDLKLEEVDSDGPGGGDDVEEDKNLAANYTNANGHVTWDTVADAWGDSNQDNKANSVYGGFSWSFALANSDYEKNPAYATIKTDDLKANRKYEFSYIYQGDYIPVLDSIDPKVEITKEEDVKLLEGDRAHRITIQFTTTKEGPMTFKLKMGKFMNNESCSWSRVILSDLGLYDITDHVYSSVKTERGGTISGYNAAYCTKGDEITITATPHTGNTFIGWFDAEGNKVSSDAVYTFTAEKDFNLIAKYSGNNLPNGEWLAEHGMDGTFENGTMFGWKAEDRDNWDDASWASFDRVNETSYNGDYSLRIRGRWRTSFFKFTDLKPRTNYHLSFYVKHPDLFDLNIDELTGLPLNDQATIQWFGVTSGGDSLYSEAGSLVTPAIKGGTGWHKVNISFTTGERTDADLELYYTNISPSPRDNDYNEYIYMDDVSLVEYTANPFINGDFEDGTTAWRGEFSEENGVGKGTNFYQNVNIGAETLNTVTFKAKGKGVAGASEIIAKDFNSADYLSSQSFVEINSDDWKTYTFDFYSSVNPDVSLFFKANEGELLVDDIVLTKAEDRGNAILEKVDFESDRFATHVPSDVFEIYNGSEGDANVHSGTKSLRFNSANAQKGVVYLFQEAFGSVQIPAKFNYKVSLYYKTTKGNTIYLAPEYLPDDSVKAEYTSTSDGWTKVDFIFNKTIASHFKMAIGNVIGKTNADFYIDDITITLSSKAFQPAPNAPIVLGYSDTVIQLLPQSGMEYSLDGTTWQTSNIFRNLSPATTYTLYQRLAETDSAEASVASESKIFKTAKAEQTLIPPAPTVLEVTENSVTLNPVEGCEYSKDGTRWQSNNVFNNLRYSSEYTFYQRYAATETTDAGEKSEGITVKTLKGTASRPYYAPTLVSKTYNSVTLEGNHDYYYDQDEPEFEFSMDGINWQKSPVFTGLLPKMYYTFYQRVAENDEHYASASSPSLVVKTDAAPERILGDISGDEKTNLNDLVLLAQYVAGWENLLVDTAALDINGDGTVNLNDVTHFARYLSGWDVQIF